MKIRFIHPFQHWTAGEVADVTPGEADVYINQSKVAVRVDSPIESASMEHQPKRRGRPPKNRTL